MYSVCIPTDCSPGKALSLRLTIRALKAQSVTPKEIIVSVNRKDKTGFIDDLCLVFDDISIVDSLKKPGNISYARNLAASKCQTKYIVFLDDDTIISSIQHMFSLFSNIDAYDFACGAKRLWAPNNWQKLISELDPITHTMTILQKLSIDPINISRRDNKQRLSNFSFIGNFGVIKTEVFKEAGGFDEDFLGWGYEDADFMQELLFRKKRFCLLDSLSIKCFHLSHHADKSKVKDNIERYEKKALNRGVKFNINHLFGIFENDGYNL